MTLQRGSTHYRIGEKVAETDSYRVYICKDVTSDRQLMLQIAAETEHNGSLDRAAYILRELKQTADLFEAEHAKRGGVMPLSYERLFPIIVDSFVWEEQGGRRTNILAFSEVDEIRTMVPLANLMSRDRLRVDLRTSAWIMGRLLKLLAFAHGEGISVRTLSGNNILLVPGRHFAVVFDWSSAQTFQAEVSAKSRAEDIASAAKAVFAAIGGHPATEDYPYLNAENGADCRYVEHLRSLMNHRSSNTEEAHRLFYKLVDEIYEKKFHPFTTLPLL